MARNGRREAVALSLASGCTVREAARQAGCGERTIHTWLGDDAFRRRVAEVRTDLFSQAVGNLSRLAGKAAEALGALLEAKNESVRLQAARAVLEGGMKMHEALDLAARLAALEARLAAPPPEEPPR
jgi:transposase-like protein